MPKQKISLINGVIKKKLGEIVFDIMEHPEEVPENFDDYVELARNMGFRDIVDGFDLIDSEIGKIQRQRTIEKRRNRKVRHEEREFQDYLISHPEKLEEIEAGLKYKSHEKIIRAGRLDIETVDKDKKEVRVELKARDVDSRENFFQIMKYFNEDDSGKSRLFFIAPTIKPDLLFALRAYQQAGRMRFFECERDNGDYTFREIKPEDIPEATEIDWSKRKRKQVDNGLVRVTAAAASTKMKRKKIEKEKVQEEQIGKFYDEEWESYPLYYKALLVSRPKLKDKKVYLNPIEIDREQKENLELLVTSNDFESAKNEFESYLPWYRTDMDELSSKLSLKLPRAKNLKKAREDYILGFERGVEYARLSKIILDKMTKTMIINGEVSNDTIDYSLQEFEDVQEALDEMIRTVKYYDKTFINFKKTLKKILKDNSDKTMSDYSKGMLFFCGLYRESLVEEFLKLKISRTKELLKIDKNLAISYLYFNPMCVPSIIETMQKEDGGRFAEIKLYPDRLHQFINEDQRLYDSILSIFKTREEPSELEQIAEKVPEVQEALIQTTSEAPTQEKTEHRKMKVHYGFPVSAVVPNRNYESLDGEKQAIVNEFVEGILNNPAYNGNARKKYANIARESKWYNQKMDAEQMRDFFNDLRNNIEDESK